MPVLTAAARTTRRGMAVAVATSVALVSFWLPGDPGVKLSGDETGSATPTSQRMRIVQANIKSGMSLARTKSDIAAVYAKKPDFVTFNEVTYRPNSLLVPKGYELWRTPGAYTGETPVAWNTARWNMVDRGTYKISALMRTAPSSKTFELGLRYANWVSLESKLGERISVISTHFAPRAGYTESLTGPSFTRLGKLVAQLRSFGPVVVGGDLNVNYKARADYPRAQVARLGLTPVFDITGVALPTGMYRNATIDYIMLSRAAQFKVLGQYVWAGYSDHRQLTADLALVGTSADAFTPGTVTSNPVSSPTAVSALVARSIDRAPEGAVVHVLTKRLNLRLIENALTAAHRRGVHVQVLTGTARSTQAENRLARLLGTNTQNKSWVVHRTRWSKYRLPTTSVFVSASGGVRALRIDVSQPLENHSEKVVTRATVMINKRAYDAVFAKFFRAVRNR